MYKGQGIKFVLNEEGYNEVALKMKIKSDNYSHLGVRVVRKPLSNWGFASDFSEALLREYVENEIDFSRFRKGGIDLVWVRWKWDPDLDEDFDYYFDPQGLIEGVEITLLRGANPKWLHRSLPIERVFVLKVFVDACCLCVVHDGNIK